MRLILLLLGLAILGGCDRQKAEERQGAPGQAETAVGTQKGVDRSFKGRPAPTAAFRDSDGRATSLARFKGRPLLVNLWATWCAPCVKELPTLNALGRGPPGGGALRVVAVSQDMGPQASVKAFLRKLKADNLAAYHDPQMALSGALGVQVLPTTVLFDASGREVWRYAGDLDWTGPEAARLLAEAAAAPAG